MKILHVTFKDYGYAEGRAVQALHRQIVSLGHQSDLLVLRQASDASDAHSLAKTSQPGGKVFDALEKKALNENASHILASFFTLGYPGYESWHPLFDEAEVIHLHDIKEVFSPALIGGLMRSGKKIVWTISDAWSFTGGCHQPAGCEKFLKDCAQCPQLNEDGTGLPGAILHDKVGNYIVGKISVVASGDWLVEGARRSIALADRPVEKIIPALDRQHLIPVEKKAARRSLGLSEDALVLLIQCEQTGARRRGRKAVQNFFEAVTHFNTFNKLARAGKLTVVALGLEDTLDDPGFPVHYWRADDTARLSLILSAVDLAVFTHMEENSGAAVMECAHFGVPVIAYDSDGIRDIIQHEKTGLVIPNWEPNLMAEAVSLALIRSQEVDSWSRACRKLSEAHPRVEDLTRETLRIYEDAVPHNPSQRFEKITVPKKFLEHCWNAAGLLISDLSGPFLRSFLEIESDNRQLKYSLRNAVKKLRLMEQRFGEKSSKNTTVERNFAKAMVSLQKHRAFLDVILRKSAVREYSPNQENLADWVENKDDLSNRLFLLRKAFKSPSPTQRVMPVFLENWLVKSVVPVLDKSAGSEFGLLIQHSPRKLKLEKFPKHGSDKNLPTIAMVTPSFMQGHFIGRTLDSITSQNYPRLSLIVQDAGSTDGTADVLKEKADKITSWSSLPDTGQARAIRDGFAKVNCDIMAWLNSDDLLLPGALRFVGEYFRDHPEVDVVYGHRVLIDENNQEIGRWVLPPHDPALLKIADYVPQETLFWRREIWDKAGGIDPKFRFAMDWDLLLRFDECGAKILRLPYFLGCFRVHAEQKTSAVMNTIGSEELNHLRIRTLGRIPSSSELKKTHADARSRSALYEMLLKWGIRL